MPLDAVSPYLPSLIDLRRALHHHPELSGAEHDTAAAVVTYLRGFHPAALLTGLAGTGVAAVFEGAAPGPTVLVRAELDALPITETGTAAHASCRPGTTHACGHDGHMASVCALAGPLRDRPPAHGRVVLLFQPAEETGTGAAALLADPRFTVLAPDYALAYHNLPGLPLGQVELRTGPFTCASRGMTVAYGGKTAHAAHPDHGLSPAGAMCRLIGGLTDLGAAGFPPAMVTVVGARLGEPSFGTAPGEARVMATLRTEDDAAMAVLVAEAERLAHDLARADGLTCTISYEDVFAACTNHPEMVDVVTEAAARVGLPLQLRARPNRWSEDFGLLAGTCKGALFTLGAGVDHPDLHHPDYDFPDALIGHAARLLLAAVRRLTDTPQGR